MTVLILLSACLVLAANSIYMADRLLEMSLNQEYIHYISIEEDHSIMELPYDDGIDREGLVNAYVTDNVFSACNLRRKYS